MDNYYLFAFLDENAQAKFVMKKLNENNVIFNNLNFSFQIFSFIKIFPFLSLKLLDIDSNTENVLDKVVKSIEAVLLENFDMKQCKIDYFWRVARFKLVSA